MKIRTETMYATGLILLVPAIICGQLLWLLDPLRLPGGIYLMDYVHVLVAAIAFIPLVWAVGALHGFTRRGISLPRKLLRLAIGSLSAASACMILINPRQVIWLGALVAAAIILIFLDFIVSEIVARRRYPFRSGAWCIISLLILVTLLWPTRYMVLYPGITMNMNRYVEADGGRVNDTLSGVLIFQRPAFPIDWLYASLFPHYTFSLQEDLGMSLGEYNHIVHVMKQDADTIAAAVAFERLGIGEGAVAQGALTIAVVEDGPAHGYLLPGDVIKQLDEDAIHSAEDLLAAIQRKQPGEAVQVTVERDGQLEKVTFATAVSDDVPQRVILGIHVIDDVHYDVPRELDFQQYLLHEGGPSHGMMLTLAIIDQLTPGGVTNGYEVAGTGTIAADGSVGAVGGVKQKAFTAERSGADVFFVPAGQVKEAQAGAVRMPIVPVKNIDDVLHWLQANKQD